MGEVLSQNEIDSLLKALSSGELDVDEMKDEDKKQVKNYDFARPAKFSRNICERWRLSLNITEDSCQPIFLFIYGKMFRLR